MPNIQPIPGPQTDFLSSSADIVFFGGGVGGGKTVALLLECLRHMWQEAFTAIIFRRKSTEIQAPGGPWATSVSLYKGQGFVPRRNHQYLDWVNPATQARIKFSHLQHESHRFDHAGGQYALICFDELISFTEKQFTFLLSRNRPALGCGVPGYVRATTNPDESSWVRDWIAPWVVPTHALFGTVEYGELLHFRRFAPGNIDDDVKPYVIHREPEGKRGDEMVWVRPECPDCKSFTYIPSSMADNPYLGGDYESSVKALALVERTRLMGQHPHCWLIRHAAGNVFNSEWFIRLEQGATLPYIHTLRCWDLAASKGAGDYTAGVKVGVTKDGRFGVIDVRRGRWSAAEVEAQIKLAARQDGASVGILIEEEKGAAGKNLIQSYRRMLSGYRVSPSPVTGDKVVRSAKASARNQQRLISVHWGPWREDFINECDGFPEAKHDDQVDGLTGAVNALVPMTHKAKVGKVRRGNFRWDS